MAKILVVDDDEYIRGVLTENVRMLDHEASSAETLSEALALLQKESYFRAGDWEWPPLTVLSRTTED